MSNARLCGGHWRGACACSGANETGEFAAWQCLVHFHHGFVRGLAGFAGAALPASPEIPHEADDGEGDVPEIGIEVVAAEVGADHRVCQPDAWPDAEDADDCEDDGHLEQKLGREAKCRA